MLRKTILFTILTTVLLSASAQVMTRQQRQQKQRVQKLAPLLFPSSKLPDSLNQEIMDSTHVLDSIATDSIAILDSIQVDTIVIKPKPVTPPPPKITPKPSVFAPLYRLRLSRLSESERLKYQYNAAVEFDTKVHFNPYRVVDWDRYKSNNNPYKLEVVPFFDRTTFSYLGKSEPTLNSTQWFSGDTSSVSDVLTQTTPFEIFIASRNNIIRSEPKYATDRWNDLPDPPEMEDNVYLSTITDLNLNYVITDRNEIRTPEKLAKKLIKQSPWKVKGSAAMHFNQSKTSKYWEKGGQDYFSILGIGLINANLIKPNLKWENNGQIRIGAIYQADNEPESLRKNEDRIRIGSKFGMKTNKMKKWYYSVNFDFDSQLFDGYSYDKNGNKTPISTFFSPAKSTFSIGMDYKKDKNLSVFMSPLTYRLTLVLDTGFIGQTVFNKTMKKYGIEEGKRSTNEFGGYIKSTYKHNITKNIGLTSNLYFFVDYSEFPLTVDLDWESTFNFQITHLFSARMVFQFVYDDNVLFDVGKDLEGNTIRDQRLQFKEFMSIGFSYRF